MAITRRTKCACADLLADDVETRLGQTASDLPKALSTASAEENSRRIRAIAEANRKLAAGVRAVSRHRRAIADKECLAARAVMQRFDA